MRLDKFLATVTDLSRSDAKRAIRDGLVAVDGHTVIDPQSKVHAESPVALGGRPLRAAVARYFMLHKPVGCVSATRDRTHSTVLDLLVEDNPEMLHIAGRLDIDTTGLVLITDDGRWAHQVTSPRHRCEKRYRVETAEPIDAEAAAQFARGIWLQSEKQRLLPARLEVLGPTTALVTVQEGKYHQVKRMFGAMGNAVVRLHREAIGSVELDSALAEGEYRPLTASEIEALRGVAVPSHET